MLIDKNGKFRNEIAWALSIKKKDDISTSKILFTVTLKTTCRFVYRKEEDFEIKFKV